MYEPVRMNGVGTNRAVFVATSVLPCGRRSILGISAACSKAEVHWREFLRSLKTRGMHGVKMITSDDHEGLKAALKGTLSGVPWQRCQFHLQQNAGQYVPRKKLRSEVAADIRAIFNAPNRQLAEQLWADSKWNDHLLQQELAHKLSLLQNIIIFFILIQEKFIDLLLI